jgi:hypothetical protein
MTNSLKETKKTAKNAQKARIKFLKKHPILEIMNDPELKAEFDRISSAGETASTEFGDNSINKIKEQKNKPRTCITNKEEISEDPVDSMMV